MRVVKKIQEAAKKAAGWSEKRNKDGTRTVGNVTFNVFGKGNKSPEQKQAMKQSWKRHWKKNPHAAELYSIDEASKIKLLNYVRKAVVDYGDKKTEWEKDLAAGHGIKAMKTMNKSINRKHGISSAAAKLSGKGALVKATDIDEAVAKAPTTTTGAKGSDLGVAKKKMLKISVTRPIEHKIESIGKGGKVVHTEKSPGWVSEQVELAVRSFYAKHYAKNYNRFISKKSPGSPVKKAVHSAYAHVGNKYGSEVERQLRQFHAGNELKEEPINEISADKVKKYIKKSANYLTKEKNYKDGSIEAYERLAKRFNGIRKASDKLSGDAKVPATDPTDKPKLTVHTTAKPQFRSTTKPHLSVVKEQTILEMSDGKIRRYIGKALGDTKRKRTKSINLAADKIEKKAKVPATLEEARNKPIPDHPYHLKSDDELRYIQKDAHAAAKAMRNHDEKAEGKYLDQVNDASTVLYYRKKHNKGKDEPKKLDESLKLLKTYEIGPHAAKVYKDSEYNEHRVKFFTDGKHHTEADYHTNDVEDAHSTASSWLNKQKEDRPGFVSRKEDFKTNLKKKRLDEAKVIGSHGTEEGNKYELLDNGSWHSIRKTHQNGKSVQNEWGGYPPMHVGTPKYIAKKWQALKASKSYTIKPFEKKDDLTEARIKIIKARIRGGKVQRRKKVSTQPGWTLRGGKLKRMSASERRKRKLGQRRGKIKRRAKLSRTLVKRKRSLVKRQRLHLK